jgi:hypothetical protein
MSRDPIKNFLKGMYPNNKDWAQKVDAMSRDQAFAIYKRVQNRREQEKLEKEAEDLAKRYPQQKLF